MDGPVRLKIPGSFMHKGRNVSTQSEHNSEESKNSSENHEALTSQESQNGNDGSISDETSQKVLQLERELSEARDRYLRTVAESENVRRRHERERSELVRYAAEGIVKDLLPVLDALDNAIQQADPNRAEPSGAERLQIIEGFRLVQKQFLDSLKKHGLEVIDSHDVEFDPNVHQAIQMIPKEGISSQMVATVFAKGYSIHGRVVRPAMVSVNVPGN
jgi:molecular chaperone GrpE